MSHSPAGPDQTVSYEHQLMRAVQAGDVDAFGELFDRYVERSLRTAGSICHDVGRTEEAVQEAFISVWRRRATYSPARGTVATWLLSVVRHRAIAIARRDHEHAAVRSGEDARLASLDAGDQVAPDDEARQMRNLLLELPEAHRAVITLAFYGQLSQAEIAKALGLPARAVKGSMRIGMHELREALGRTEAPRGAAGP